MEDKLLSILKHFNLEKFIPTLVKNNINSINDFINIQENSLLKMRIFNYKKTKRFFEVQKKVKLILEENYRKQQLKKKISQVEIKYINKQEIPAKKGSSQIFQSNFEDIGNKIKKFKTIYFKVKNGYSIYYEKPYNEDIYFIHQYFLLHPKIIPHCLYHQKIDINFLRYPIDKNQECGVFLNIYLKLENINSNFNIKLSSKNKCLILDKKCKYKQSYGENYICISFVNISNNLNKYIKILEEKDLYLTISDNKPFFLKEEVKLALKETLLFYKKLYVEFQKTDFKWFELKNVSFDNYLRLGRSKTCKPISIDEKKQKGFFLGANNEEYETSLTNCSCKDFLENNYYCKKDIYPCKHMYALAKELKIIKSNENPIVNFSIPISSGDPYIFSLVIAKQQKKNFIDANWKEEDDSYIHLFSKLGFEINDYNYSPQFSVDFKCGRTKSILVIKNYDITKLQFDEEREIYAVFYQEKEKTERIGMCLDNNLYETGHNTSLYFPSGTTSRLYERIVMETPFSLIIQKMHPNKELYNIKFKIDFTLNKGFSAVFLKKFNLLDCKISNKIKKSFNLI